uniref:Uncharacterized protein n=1 Tax=Candidatus Kentrum sp. FW TaxID=2126338 RepID=A0A450SRD2_9GAMM|nr:MAG: hypothetical protein BECKFW1821A_GA0114235_102324 [Candidatus Kentron sp. FW]VFJ56530.1 MAG: hypothetical protein BECKFW1821B_GA0114236_102818 [Candidatus Kentron sp. FW]
MITSPILEEKYRVQKKLTEESGYDVRKYAELCHKIAVEAAAKYGLTLKYGQREGGYLEPLIPRSEGRDPGDG